MPAPIQQQITFFPCRDIDSTHEFYTKVMGFEMVLDQGACRIYQTTETAFVGFCSSAEPISSAGVMLTVITEDVEGWAQSIAEKGWPIELQPRVNERFNILQCFVRDPDGHLLEIQRFLHPFPG